MQKQGGVCRLFSMSLRINRAALQILNAKEVANMQDGKDKNSETKKYNDKEERELKVESRQASADKELSLIHI